MGFMHESVISTCLERLKALLKQRGLSYAEVAGQLGVSEVTVKRMLNQRDIPVSRLLELAAIAGCDLPELLREAQAQDHCPEQISPRQDDAFCRYPHLFQFYRSLVENGLDADRVAALFDLDELSVYLYLRALENLELLELLPGNRVRMPEQLLSFARDSRFIRKGVASVFETARNELLDPQWKQGEDVDRDMSIMFLYQEHVEKLMEELGKVLLRFARYERRPERLRQGDEPLHQFVMLRTPLREPLPQFEVPRVRRGDLRV